ncbi:MAG: PQQ-dependent sugar dehydrogenase [Gammaproteobacteria bacterium]
MNDEQRAMRPASLPHHLLAALLIALVPALVADHAGALFNQVAYQTIAAGFAGVYLLCAVFLEYRSRRHGLPSALQSLTLGAAFLCPLVIAVALFSLDGEDRSPDEFARRDLVAASLLLLGFVVVLSSVRLSRIVSTVGAVLMALVVAATSAGLVAQGRGLLPGSRAYVLKQTEIMHKSVDAPFYVLNVTRYRNFIEAPDSLGGGLTRLGGGELLATGDGDLYEVTAKSLQDPLTIRRLALHVPINPGDMVADGRSAMDVSLFRVMDILVSESGGRVTLFAAHHYWHRDRHCFVQRVSRWEGTADELRRAPANTSWQVLYDTAPCLRTEDVQRTPYTGFVESGGRLARVDDHHLMLSTGDHEFDGLHSKEIAPQDPTSGYGKMILIDIRDGKAAEYSNGHRDPQGLFITSEGAIWSTEHGPQGGDELNLILAGRNYGWPRVTLGTDYGRTTWPMSQRQGSHEGYEAPVFSWTPAIGISNLLRIEGDAFPVWKGDLLVGALRGRAVWRVRVENGRVLFAAPIPLGLPVRDLLEDAYGRIVIWTDRDLLTLEPATSVEAGESQAAPCLVCHTLYPDAGEHSVGPNLQGIVGRRVASAPGFPYSSNLKALGGSWSRKRLDAFLTNPQKYAPGNGMRFAGVADQAQRKKIIDFLETRLPP